MEAAKTPARSFICAHLDYCNSFFAGLAACNIKRLRTHERFSIRESVRLMNEYTTIFLQSCAAVS